MHVRAESWLGDRLLADDIPVADGLETVDRTLRVPERVVLTVPVRERGVDWSPTAPGAPLAAFGQRLRITLGVSLPGGRVEWLNRGWFLITDSGVEDDEVQVEAIGLLGLVDEARLVSPYQPSGTMLSTLRALVEPALTVDATQAPPNRNIPSTIAVDDDRLGAVLDLLDAWPADVFVTQDGYLKLVPAGVNGTAALHLTDGVGGTVLRWSGQTSRGGAVNVVVARGSAADGGFLQGVAYDLTTTSPTFIGGEFSPLSVPYVFTSSALTNITECQSAAEAILARRRRLNGRKLTADVVPDPRIQTGDVVTVTSADLGLDRQLCVVEALGLPYTPSGPMSLTVRVVEPGEGLITIAPGVG